MVVFLLFIVIWLTIAAAVIAVHFWFLTVPILGVGGTLVIRRQRRNKQIARRRAGPRDPWLNEVVVAAAELGFEEQARNLSDHYYNVAVEGHVELRKDRLSVDVVIFANQILTRNAEVAMRALPSIRGEIGREMTAIHNGGRVLVIARTKMGCVDEFDFAELVRLVGEIPLPPPFAIARPVAYRSPAAARPAPAPSRTMTPTLPAPLAAPAPAPPDQDAIDQLDRLGRLRTSGVLTEAEFQAKKAELLQRI